MDFYRANDFFLYYIAEQLSMKGIIRYKRSAFVIFFIATAVFLLTKCISNEKEKEVKETGAKETEAGVYNKKIHFGQFAGSATCAGCHKKIYEKHINTGHYLTSQPALEKYIKGSFKKGKNTYAYSSSTILAMEKRDSGLYQVAYHNGEEKKALRFGIVTGSGAKGQSYLYWDNNRLFQMPITYYTNADQWSNSPGFPQKVLFNRPITSRCLECHATFAETISAPGKEPEEFDHDRMLFGVDCEKCHGPAAAHVEFQTKNSAEKKAKYIINPASLTRQQNMDLCALCHGGALSKNKPSFEFTVGDTLSDFFVLKDLNSGTPNYDNVDVHGNQYGLLTASKCFTMSNMTCNSCHNTHENERGNTVLFSQRCMNCHSVEHGNFCKMSSSIGASITRNCIDCHMPAKPSQAITIQLPGSDVPTAATVRSHFISIYPDEVKR